MATRGLSLFEADGGKPIVHVVPAVSVPVVDTTGAGDVLHAALIADWLLAEAAGGRRGPICRRRGGAFLYRWGVGCASATQLQSATRAR